MHSFIFCLATVSRVLKSSTGTDFTISGSGLRKDCLCRISACAFYVVCSVVMYAFGKVFISCLSMCFAWSYVYLQSSLKSFSFTIRSWSVGCNTFMLTEQIFRIATIKWRTVVILYCHRYSEHRKYYVKREITASVTLSTKVSIHNSVKNYSNWSTGFAKDLKVAETSAISWKWFLVWLTDTMGIFLQRLLLLCLWQKTRLFAEWVSLSSAFFDDLCVIIVYFPPVYFVVPRFFKLSAIS